MPFIEYTPIRIGLVTWDAKLDGLALAQGRGMLQVPESSAIADLTGKTTMPVEVYSGAWAGLGGQVRSQKLPPNSPPGTDEVQSIVLGAALGGLGGGIAAWRGWRWLTGLVGYTRIAPDARRATRAGLASSRSCTRGRTSRRPSSRARRGGRQESSRTT